MPVLDEAALARAAAAGDGQAFATLYDEYEGKIFNFCLRLVGTREDAADATQDAFVKVLQRLPKLPEDRELNFGAYLFTAARNASYDLIGRRKRADPVDLIPEAGARPLSGDERGDLYIDPERVAMLGALQESVQAANARLPERQREVLALREVEEMSYDEIAEIMDMNRNAVAQLISRARIKLRDELRGTALASVAVTGSDCARALPLIAMRQDGQLSDLAEIDWLDAHVAGCPTCKVATEAMQEAGMSYRAWAPVLPVIWLWKSTAAKAAELTGSDWSDLLDRPRELRTGASDSGVGTGAGVGAGAGAGAGGGFRDLFNGRRVAGAVFVSLFALLTLGAVVLSHEETPPASAINAADTSLQTGSTGTTATTPAGHKTKKVVVTHVHTTASGATITTQESVIVPVNDAPKKTTHHTTSGSHTTTTTVTTVATTAPAAPTPVSTPAPATTPPPDTTPTETVSIYTMPAPPPTTTLQGPPTQTGPPTTTGPPTNCRRPPCPQ